MIISSIALVLLTAAAAGLPAIWLIRGQLERQVWTQIEQGGRVMQMVYAAGKAKWTAWPRSRPNGPRCLIY